MTLEELTQVILDRNAEYNAKFPNFRLSLTGTGLTIVPRKEVGAFNLTSPMVATLTNLENKKKKPVAVVRATIKISDIPYYSVENVEELIGEMHQQIYLNGDCKPDYMTFTRPGSNNILQLTEVGESYELRLVAFEFEDK